ncbi:MAG: 50S ribosomal protein L2 [Candidatus Aenigmarchaeota archaeon]|nr:50S ribosomal protein L2 [Candidatus Aenigmarchaeota archaeon]
MGKNLRQQRRGKGTPRYISPGHRFPGAVSYPSEIKDGTVVGLKHASGRTSPVAVVDFEGKRELMLPAEGTHVGQKVEFKKAGEGNVTTIGSVPEGSKIFNIELNPGDGGKLCRSSGAFAILVTQGKDKCVVLLPSKKKKVLSSRCRATIGSVAGSGRVEKPFVKAGARFYKMSALGKMHARVSGVAMNPVDHPFGGSAKPGKHKSVSRDAPPGRKVGSISPARTGKRKRGS